MYLEVFLDGWKEAEKRAKAVGKKGKATKRHAAGGTDVVENLSMKELAETRSYQHGHGEGIVQEGRSPPSGA